MSAAMVKKQRTLSPLKMIRELYDWTMRWSNHPRATWALGFFSMIEGIFFPIPIDPFLFAVSAGTPKKSFHFATIAALTSVVGGTIGYMIGLYFWDSIKDLFFTYMFTVEKFAVVEQKFHDDAFLAVFLASFTPIPYKVCAVAAGVFKISLSTFIISSILGRCLRFYVIAFLFYFWGAPIRDFIEKHFNKLTIAIGVLCVAVVFLTKVL